MNYEQEEEFLTNDLSRKLMQVGSTLFFLACKHSLIYLMSG